MALASVMAPRSGSPSQIPPPAPAQMLAQMQALQRLGLASDPVPTQDAAADPFAASLVSLSDAAAMALDAISLRGVPVQPPAAAAPGTATTPTPAGTTVALAAARALRSATQDPALAGLASPATLGALAAAGPDPRGAGNAARIASALDASLVHRLGGSADAGDVAGDTLGDPGVNSTGQTGVAAAVTQPATAGTDAALAASAAGAAAAAPEAVPGSDPAFQAELLAVLAAESASASGAAGPDAVAKYMGAGFMGLGAAGADAALEANPDVPAVNGVFQVLAQTPNTYSNPRERAYGQSAQPRTARSPATVSAAGPAMVDLLG